MPTSGTYLPTGEIYGDRHEYLGASNAVLRFETVAGGSWGAKNWLNGKDGWVIKQGGKFRYALKTTKDLPDVRANGKWKVKNNAVLPMHVFNCNG